MKSLSATTLALGAVLFWQAGAAPLRGSFSGGDEHVAATPVAPHLSTTEWLQVSLEEYRDPLDLYVLLFETDTPDDSTKMDVFVAQQSADAGIKTTVIGEGKEFVGFASKWAVALDTLNTLPPDALAVIADSRDVLLNIHTHDNSTQQVVDTFTHAFRALTRNHPGSVVMAAEGQCCVSALSHAKPGDYFDESTGERRHRACNSGKKGCFWTDDAASLPWESFQQDLAIERTGAHLKDVYLNAGLVAGRPADLIRLVETADMDETEDDQAVFTDLMYRHPESIILDYAQEMFGNARWTMGMTQEGCPFDISEGQTGLVHHETKTTPMFIHFPGKFWECHEATAKKLGIVAPKENHRRQLQDNYNYRPECERVKIDFEKSAGGTSLAPGTYVSNEWEDFGLLLSASGGFGSLPRLFDTANPGEVDDEYGDPDLGAPNYDCPYPGPGIGEGGRQGEPGENCEALGNVLIIQENNDNLNIPDDNSEGGTITFTFLRETDVYAIALLDVDYETVLTVYYVDGTSNKVEVLRVPELGDNSYQELNIDIPRVTKMELTSARSAAVVSLDICYEPIEEQCTEYRLDFEESAGGGTIYPGDYLDNQWEAFGLLLSSSGGFGTKPRVFDTANPGTIEKGDPDLGAPNAYCPYPGPGEGDGGKPGKPGENCNPLGHVLIIQEDNEHLYVPDDNADGGTVTFTFFRPAKVTKIGLLDIDYRTKIYAEFVTDFSVGIKAFSVPELGDNSYQELDLEFEGLVQKLELYVERSGAVAFLDFCYY